jgi:hypothetical protein
VDSGRRARRGGVAGAEGSAAAVNAFTPKNERGRCQAAGRSSDVMHDQSRRGKAVLR